MSKVQVDHNSNSNPDMIPRGRNHVTVARRETVLNRNIGRPGFTYVGEIRLTEQRFVGKVLSRIREEATFKEV